MKRRNFVRQSSLVGLASLFTIPLVDYSSIQFSKSRGFKNMLNTSNLNKSSISNKLNIYLESLKGRGFKNMSSEAYTYNGHALLSTEKKGTLFTKKGMLFITAGLMGYKYVFLEDIHLNELDELMYSYVKGMKENNKEVNTADFLLPHKIVDNYKYVVSYINKFGNRIDFKRTNNKTRILIS